MHEMKIFNNEEFGQVRTVTVDNEPMFCLADVCKALELNNVSQLKTRLKDDGVITNEVIDTLGRKQTATFINEANLYKTIFQSRKPSAERFTDWVTSEVLPTIRKHGVYVVDEVLNNPDMMIAALTELKKEREKVQSLTEIKAVQEQQIMELQPKATYYDLVLNCKDLLSVTEIAKDFGKSAKWLNNFLKEPKIQFKQGDLWFLYKKYAEQGYTSTKTHTVNGTDGQQHSKVHTYWTQKGRLFIYGLLKNHGILPIIEQEQSA